MQLQDFLVFGLGVLGTLWFTTVGGLAYALWRYVYVPWKIMRADLKALNSKLDETNLRITNELGLRRAQNSLSPEEQLRAENRLNARRRDAALSASLKEVIS